MSNVLKVALNLTMSKCHIKSKIIGSKGLRKNIFLLDKILLQSLMCLYKAIFCPKLIFPLNFFSSIFIHAFKCLVL